MGIMQAEPIVSRETLHPLRELKSSAVLPCRMGAGEKLSKAKAELMLAYVGGLGLTAIKVLVGNAGETPCWLQIQAEPDLIESDGPLVTFDTLWFSKASHAELVYQQCLAVLDVEQDVAINLCAAEVRDTVVNEAGNLGAAWRLTQEIVATAETAVDEVERHIVALNASGGLSSLNAGYKRYRLAMQATGVAATTYSTYLLGFKIKMAKRIAENVASGADKFAGLSSIFPGSLGIFRREEEFTDPPPSSRVYANRGWSNHSFRKRE
jgi:hypothetical protein